MKYGQEFIEEAQRIMKMRPNATSDVIASLISQRLNVENIGSLGRQVRRWEKLGTIKRGVITPAKILVFDIETLPLVSYTWGKWKQNISDSQIIKDWAVACWSAKWLFNETIYNASLSPQEAIDRNDKRIMESLWAMIDEADIILAHNLKKFDEKRVNTRFLKYGMDVPSPYKTIDTLLAARRRFAITSNRLDYLAKFLELPSVGKMRTDFELWRGCDEGDYDALEYMQKYCDHDIQLLEDVYVMLRPWIDNHPNMGLTIGQEISVCSKCGSDELKFDTKTPYRTTVNEYVSYRCGGCGGVGWSRRASTPVKVRQSLLK